MGNDTELHTSTPDLSSRLPHRDRPPLPLGSLQPRSMSTGPRLAGAPTSTEPARGPRAMRGRSVPMPSWSRSWRATPTRRSASAPAAACSAWQGATGRIASTASAATRRISAPGPGAGATASCASEPISPTGGNPRPNPSNIPASEDRSTADDRHRNPASARPACRAHLGFAVAAEVSKPGRLDQSGSDSKGSMAGMSSGAKCRRFRVRTARPWTPAVAAMARSAKPGA